MTKTSVRKTKAARLPRDLELAVEAARDKKAHEIVVLDLRKAHAFTDYFLICSAQNQRQLKAIVESVEETLARNKVKPAHVEGHDHAEWVLLDFFDFIVHVFTPETRAFYALERLWGSADRIEIAADEPATGGS